MVQAGTRDESELGEIIPRLPEATFALVRVGHLGRLDRDEAMLLPLDGGVREVSFTRVPDGEAARVERSGAAVVVSCDDPWMSAPHARLVRDGGRCRLVDAGSKNGSGVWREGEASLRRSAEGDDGLALRHQDLLLIGRTVFRLHDRRLVEPDELVALSDVALGPARSVAPGLLEELRLLVRAAPSVLTVLLLGSSGSGKEVMARALHGRSRRRGAFVAVNCAALPDGMVEGQLFGYRKGAFTGAVDSSPGLVASADGGTLFLDEIGDMPLAAQAKLLRVLQEREVVPLGEAVPRKVDLRVVAATHVDLETRVSDGRFRGDLFARLSQVTVRLPPLVERREDLGVLLPFFTARARVRLGLEAARALLVHDYPYQVRELASIVEAAALQAGAEGVIQLDHLPATLRAKARLLTLGATTPAVKVAAVPVASVDPAAAPSRDALEAMLVRHRGNVTAMARELGKGKMQLYRWFRRHQLDPARFR